MRKRQFNKKKLQQIMQILHILQQNWLNKAWYSWIQFNSSQKGQCLMELQTLKLWDRNTLQPRQSKTKASFRVWRLRLKRKKESLFKTLEGALLQVITVKMNRKIGKAVRNKDQVKKTDLLLKHLKKESIFLVSTVSVVSNAL